MKIVITGASGYVGQSIIPILIDHCDEILVVGRDVEKLARLFPDLPRCKFDEIRSRAQGFDALVHLSVLNNDAVLQDANFDEVNVKLAIDTAQSAACCGIEKFYNISSIHALDDENTSQYAKSKREAVLHLAKISNIEVINLYLPFVLGQKWNGKLTFLNRMPSLIAKPLEACLLALKPSVTAEQLASYITLPDERSNIVILTDGQSNNVVYKVVKRGTDLLFAVAVILLLWWALLIVWALVRLGSPGPGIFSQKRIGLHGQSFTCYKFRTMQEGTRQAGTHEVSQASVTQIGRFLRKTKFDELPQIWNILKNEISLIGPRPGLPMQQELYEVRKKMGVFNVKPGISGLAQINDIDMSDPAKLANWDAKYIALQSLFLDLKIIVRTIRGGGQGDKVS